MARTKKKQSRTKRPIKRRVEAAEEAIANRYMDEASMPFVGQDTAGPGVLRSGKIFNDICLRVFSTWKWKWRVDFDIELSSEAGGSEVVKGSFSPKGYINLTDLYDQVVGRQVVVSMEHPGFKVKRIKWTATILSAPI